MFRLTIGTIGWAPLLGVAGLLGMLGCHNTPVDLCEYAHSPAPLRVPPPDSKHSDCYECCLTGERVFMMYCGACHNARSLAERPFSSYQNVATHMRVRANLTGKEYAELLAWMRHWADVPPPNPPVEPSPKRFFFSQPISELRKEAKKVEKPVDREGAAEEPAAPAAPVAANPER